MHWYHFLFCPPFTLSISNQSSQRNPVLYFVSRNLITSPSFSMNKIHLMVLLMYTEARGKININCCKVVSDIMELCRLYLNSQLTASQVGWGVHDNFKKAWLYIDLTTSAMIQFITCIKRFAKDIFVIFRKNGSLSYNFPAVKKLEINVAPPVPPPEPAPPIINISPYGVMLILRLFSLQLPMKKAKKTASKLTLLELTRNES